MVPRVRQWVPLYPKVYLFLLLSKALGLCVCVCVCVCSEGTDESEFVKHDQLSNQILSSLRKTWQGIKSGYHYFKESFCPPFLLSSLLRSPFSHSVGELWCNVNKGSLAPLRSSMFWIIDLIFSKRQHIALFLTAGIEGGRESHGFSCGSEKPISVLSASPCAACEQGITVLSDYGSLDGCMYFWDGFKGQSHAQRFACVIFIPSNTRHQPISNV